MVTLVMGQHRRRLMPLSQIDHLSELVTLLIKVHFFSFGRVRVRIRAGKQRMMLHYLIANELIGWVSPTCWLAGEALAERACIILQLCEHSGLDNMQVIVLWRPLQAEAGA